MPHPRFTEAILFGLVSCSIPGEGSGQIYSDVDAPFPLNSASTFLWWTDPRNNGDDGLGLLLIADGDYACERPQDAEDLVENLDDGMGLVFLLSYDTDRDDDAPAPAWDGLYLGGFSYDYFGGEERAMLPMAFYGGKVSSLLYSSLTGTWLRVDDGTTDAMEGEFYTEYWNGTFSAEVCGDFPRSIWGRYDYYGYDDDYDY